MNKVIAIVTWLLVTCGAVLAADLEPIEASGLENAPPTEVWKAWTTGDGLGFTDDTESARMREFFKRGNEFTLQQLQKRFR